MHQEVKALECDDCHIDITNLEDKTTRMFMVSDFEWLQVARKKELLCNQCYNKRKQVHLTLSSRI